MPAAKVKNRNWIVTALLAGGVLAYMFFMFLPRQKAIGQVRSEITEKQEALTRALGLSGSIEDAEKKGAAAREFVEGRLSRLAKPSEVPALLAQLSTEAEAAGAKILRFDPQQPVNYETFQQSPLVLTCEGKFQNLTDFVRRIEQLPKLIWVEQLNFERSDERSDSVRCQLNLVIFAGKSDISN